MLGDPENFIPANPLVTPIHIQPEWYFLFAYAILRSIPNKLGGVLALFAAVIILYPLIVFKPLNFKGTTFNPALKLILGLLRIRVVCLTWIGARPVEDPYIVVGQGLTLRYFSYFLL